MQIYTADHPFSSPSSLHFYFEGIQRLILFIYLFLSTYRESHSSDSRRNKELVGSLSKPSKNFKELKFPNKYNQSYFEQFIACLWKQNLSYWRNPQYTAVRFFYTVVISLMLGSICWRFGGKRYFLEL